jgi:hypothetical protein
VNLKTYPLLLQIENVDCKFMATFHLCLQMMSYTYISDAQFRDIYRPLHIKISQYILLWFVALAVRNYCEEQKTSRKAFFLTAM